MLTFRFSAFSGVFMTHLHHTQDWTLPAFVPWDQCLTRAFGQILPEVKNQQDGRPQDVQGAFGLSTGLW